MKLLGFMEGNFPKKYIAILNDNGKIKKVSFGDQRFKQYEDRTPLKLYSHLNHLDKKRKELYYKRHNKEYPMFSADWFSKTYLWPK